MKGLAIYAAIVAVNVGGMALFGWWWVGGLMVAGLVISLSYETWKEKRR